MTTQATFWQAQLADGSKMTGGRPLVGDVNVSAVPLDKIKVFTIAHNTFSHTFYAPTKTWYKDGKAWPGFTYPAEYTLEDGSTLTVGYDTATKQLNLTQV